MLDSSHILKFSQARKIVSVSWGDCKACTGYQSPVKPGRKLFNYTPGHCVSKTFYLLTFGYGNYFVLYQQSEQEVCVVFVIISAAVKKSVTFDIVKNW